MAKIPREPSDLSQTGGATLGLPLSRPPGEHAREKGRHRRFEEARKLKQSGPEAFGFGRTDTDEQPRTTTTEDDEYAELAAKYGVEFDDDDETDDEDY